jgi:hypothetical protein
MLTKKNLISGFIALLTFFWMLGCENSSDSPTKPITQVTYGTVDGTVYFAGTITTVPGVLVICGDVSATTSNDGKFSLKNVPSGYQNLKATKNDFSPFSRNIQVVENSTSRFDIDMTAASSNKSLKGTVYQKDNLAPLANVRVILVSDTTFTDAFGKYQLPIISQGLKTIKAEKTGYNSFSNQVFISNSDIQYDITLDKLP